MKNLEKQVFGKLKVLNYNKKIGKWDCQCDCGKTCSAKTNQLTTKRKKSCGCLKFPNMLNKKFGKLTVIDFTENNKYGKRKCVCRCDCGKVSNVINSSLVSGKTKSCGCLIPEAAKKRLWKGHGEISGSLWSRIKNQAISRNLSIDITIEYAWDLFIKQGKKCNLTGLPLTFNSTHASSDGTASLDRIDSKSGYTKDNVQWIHKDVNQMKMDLNEGYFIEMCLKIAKFSQGHNL